MFDLTLSGRLTIAFSQVNYEVMLDKIRIVVERFPDGYVAYPLGVRGIVVGQGQTEVEAIADCRSALRFHMETFGPDEIDPIIPLETHLVVSAF